MDDNKVLAAIEALAQGQAKMMLAITRVGEDQTSLQSGMTSLQSATTSLQSAMTSFRAVVMGKFESIENRLTSMAEDITVTMMAVETEAKRRRGDRTEMADIVEMQLAMQRQLHRLRTDVDEIQRKAS